MNNVKKNLDLAAGIIAIIFAAYVAISSVVGLFGSFMLFGYGINSVLIITIVLIILSLALSIIVLINGIKTVQNPGAMSKKNNIIAIVMVAVLFILTIIGFVPSLLAIIKVLTYPMMACIIGFKVVQLCLK